MTFVGDFSAIARLHPAGSDADGILRDRVAEALGIPAGEVLVGRACPRCGSSDHGRPWARARGGRDEALVSLSRCGEYLMTAVARRAGTIMRAGISSGIGVDLELIAAVGHAWYPELTPDLVLHPAERGLRAPRTAREQAALWAGKEAVLKARGVGLEVPMSEVLLAEHDVVELPAPPGHVAALALH